MPGRGSGLQRHRRGAGSPTKIFYMSPNAQDDVDDKDHKDDDDDNGQHDCAPISFHPCCHLPPPIAPLFISLAFTLSLSLVLAVVAATVVVAVVAAVFAAASFSGPRKTKGQGQGASSRAGKGKKPQRAGKGKKRPERAGRCLRSLRAGCSPWKCPRSKADDKVVLGSEFELLVADQLIVNRIMSASPLALRTLSLQMTKLSNSYAQAP